MCSIVIIYGMPTSEGVEYLSLRGIPRATFLRNIDKRRDCRLAGIHLPAREPGSYGAGCDVDDVDGSFGLRFDALVRASIHAESFWLG